MLSILVSKLILNFTGAFFSNFAKSGYNASFDKKILQNI